MTGSAIEITGSKGGSIRSVRDWFREAPPKLREKQWKDGRSAKELALAWFQPAIPSDLVEFLNSHGPTRGLRLEKAMAEHVTRLDTYRGEHRNHDLVLIGDVRRTRTVIGIEAKADESFGDTLADYVRKALARPTKTRTKAPERLELLGEGLFGRQDIAKKRPDLMYQLLSGTAGTLIEAKKQTARQVIFLVHEFKKGKPTPKMAQNRKSLNRFVRELGAKPAAAGSTGWLVGPIKVPGGEFIPGDIPLYIGLLTTELA
jgi:hypothetical protein